MTGPLYINCTPCLDLFFPQLSHSKEIHNLPRLVDLIFFILRDFFYFF